MAARVWEAQKTMSEGKQLLFNKKLARILAQHGLLDEDQADQALVAAEKDDVCLDQRLLEDNQVSEPALIGCVAAESGLAPIDLQRYQPPADALDTLTPDLATHYQILPLARLNGLLTVAIANPYDVLAIDDLRVITGLDVHPVISSSLRIGECIERLYRKGAKNEHENEKTAPRPAPQAATAPAPTPLGRNFLDGHDWPTFALANEQFADHLKKTGLASESSLNKAREQDNHGLAEHLVDMGAIKENDLAAALVSWRGTPYIDPDCHLDDPEAAQALPWEAARRYGMVPLDFCGKVLTAASCHFLDEPITLAIEEATDCRLKCLVCTLGAVRRYHKLQPAA